MWISSTPPSSLGRARSVASERLADLLGGAELGRVGVAGPLGRTRDPAELEVPDRLAADEVVDDLLALRFAAASRALGPRSTICELNAPARPRSEAKIDDRGRASIISGSVVSRWSTFEYVATAETARVTARANGAEARTRASAFWMREAAMSSIALVIFLVVWADLIFCR